ncbi:MAG: hemerythrin domain-containing protein [Chloroflexi bacterium]|nr:hemerythrin domain-containing protein [Chloroflexota bacterium]
MSFATQDLRDEHQGILAMLAVVEAAAFRVRDGKAVPRDLMLNASEFFRNFADKCHHGKEEDRLFPKMIESGISDAGGPIGVMKEEHIRGRALVGAMLDAAQKFAQGDASVTRELARTTLDYVALLRDHIDKEDNVFFPEADRAIPESVQRALKQSYDEFEANVMGAGVHERYHAMIDAYQKLAASWK